MSIPPHVGVVIEQPMGTVYGGKPVFGGGIAPVSHNAEVEDARERFTPGDLKGGAGKRG